MKYRLKIIAALLCVLPASTIKAQLGIVTTICGTGISGDTGDGGPANQAQITGAGSGIFDIHGNYYFLQQNSKIRKIDTAGIITTIAGTGNAGYSGDGGLAITADLNYPKQFAIDSIGNIYIADNGNFRVRKIDVITGIITTIAGNGTNTYSGDGGPAINAGLGYVYSICLDPNGNIYVGGSLHYIRKINTSGIITTYAGTGNIGYGGDGGLAINADIANIVCLLSDKDGNIFVSAGNVRRIDALTSIITKIAGNNVFGYNGENVLADTTSIGVPYAMGFDYYHNLFLAEADNNRIRKIDSMGYIHTVVGTGIGGFNGDNGRSDTTKVYLPEGIAFDSCNNLFFIDLMNYRIRKVAFNPTCAPLVDTTDTTNSIHNLAAQNSISIYPNPAKEQLTITGGSNAKDIAILNAVGQLVITQKSNSYKASVDISSLKYGLYFIVVKDPATGQKTTKRFLKE